MKKLELSLVLCMILSVVGFLRAADEGHQHEHATPEQLGTVSFPTTCAPAVQKQFERSVALLHSFGYEEAARSLAAVTQADPGCRMAYWGVAMSLYHPLWEKPSAAALKEGWDAIEKAKSPAPRTQREQDYIAALEVFYKDSDKLDHATRAQAYEHAMEQVYSHYPEDREAAVFYALSLLGTATALPPDKTYSRQRKAGAILEKVFAEQPDHPGVAHYIIHSYDYPPLAERAMNAARSYSKIAPSAPHALHMPSHIFTRLGLWQDSITSNLASAAAARDYAARLHMQGHWTQELHAMDYLEYAYLQTGEETEASRVLQELNAIQSIEPRDLNGFYAQAAIPARYTIERRQWSEAAGLKPQSSPYPATEAITYWARALGSAHSGDAAEAAQNVEKLSEIHAALVASKESFWASHVEIQHLEASAWLEHARKNEGEAFRLMRAAADLEDSTEKHPVTPGPVLPAHEMMGDLLLELNQPESALKEFETSLHSSPGRFNGLYGAGRAAELADHPEQAKQFYAQLVESCEQANTKRVELNSARTYLAKK
jgi:hypothetical protein